MKNKVAHIGLYIALALICSYLESLIPFHIGIPGIKLGLANLIAVIVLYKMGPRYAAFVSVIRVVLAGFLFGNLFAILYSMAGCTLSLLVMTLLKRTDRFGIYGISMAGAVGHNIGQILVAAFVVETFSVTYYIPVLLIAGVITGMIIGILSNEMLMRLNRLE